MAFLYQQEAYLTLLCLLFLTIQVSFVFLLIIQMAAMIPVPILIMRLFLLHVLTLQYTHAILQKSTVACNIVDCHQNSYSAFSFCLTHS